MARRWMMLAVVVAALWGVVLAGLALFTAGRVTLNREQIRRADFLVTATVRDRREGLVAVERQWKRNGELPFERLRLDNLSETEARTNRTYLIPVSRLPDGRFRVTPTGLPGTTPLVYPATQETFEQLEKHPAQWRPAGEKLP